MNSIVQTQLLKDILENNTLYEVEEIEGKLEYKLDDNGKKIYICEKYELDKFQEVSLKNKEYVVFQKGKNHYIQSYNEENPGEIPLATGSVKNNSIAYYVNPINESDIVRDVSVSFNKDGDTTAFYRDYTYLMDRHHIAIIPSKKINAKYLFFAMENIFNNIQYGWGEHVANAEEVAKNKIYIPKNQEVKGVSYTSVKLQQSIAKNIEDKKQKIKEKYKILTTMELLCHERIENIKKNFFVNEINGEISINGQIVQLKEINFRKVKLYSDNTKKEFIANKRMGTSEVKESFLENDLVNWYTIRDLNSHVGLYIKEPKTSALISQSKMEKTFPNSNKKIPIQKDDILISFKQTIGITKIYDTDNPSYCSEAIDILTIVDKKKYYNDYIALLLKEEYLKYVQQNVGSTTLNDKLKNKIFLPIPYHNSFDSYLLQQEIFKYINGKTEEIHSNLINIKNLRNILKKAEESLWKF
jgi:hypothetical protein